MQFSACHSMSDRYDKVIGMCAKSYNGNSIQMPYLRVKNKFGLY